MIEPSLALQKTLRARLVAASGVTALVPAANIRDSNGRPAVLPMILLGEGMTGEDDGIARNRFRVVADLHVWANEPGLAQSKQIMGAIRDALREGPFTAEGFHVVDLRIVSTRPLRDPGGELSHGIVSIEARLLELA